MGKLKTAFKRLPLLFKEDVLDKRRDSIIYHIDTISNYVEWAIKQDDDSIPVKNIETSFWELKRLLHGEAVCDNIRNNILRHKMEVLSRKVSNIDGENAARFDDLSRRVKELEKKVPNYQ